MLLTCCYRTDAADDAMESDARLPVTVYPVHSETSSTHIVAMHPPVLLEIMIKKSNLMKSFFLSQIICNEPMSHSCMYVYMHACM